MSEVVNLRSERVEATSIDTPTSRRIAYAIKDSHDNRRLCVIRGGVGVGKTRELERYASANPSDVAFVTLEPATRSVTAGLTLAYAAVKALRERSELRLHHDPAVRTGYPLTLTIKRHLEDLMDAGYAPLLIVDEANFARPDLLDTFRAFYDRGLCALVIAGNETLFDPRAGRMRAADFAPLLRRAHHVLDIPKSTDADIDAVLDAYRIAGKRSRDLLRRSAAGGGIGEMIEVISKARELGGTPPILYEHLEAAAPTTGLLAMRRKPGG